jgi:hypothetical protein
MIGNCTGMGARKGGTLFNTVLGICVGVGRNVGQQANVSVIVKEEDQHGLL